MTKVKLAINGFGRIGRVAFRSWWEHYRQQAEIVAINTSGSMPVEGWAHLLLHDSNYGHFPALVRAIAPRKSDEIGRLLVGGQEFPVLAQRDPSKIHWRQYQVETVLEATGVFLDQTAKQHFKGGAKKVVISAPPKDPTIPIYILGVNAKNYRGEDLVSNGSCTTNAVAPVLKLIDETFGFREAVMTTIHAYTSSQRLVDDSHHDLRRARAAALNIVPTGTGAASAVVAAYPEAKGRFAASAIRVPVSGGSYADFVFHLQKKATVDTVNQVLIKAASGKLVGILKVTYEPLVSRDILGNTASGIVDLPMTQLVNEDMLHLGIWYDNEYGYASRLLEMALLISRR